MDTTLRTIRRLGCFTVVALLLAGASGGASATPFSIPTVLSGAVGPDTDGSGYFATNQSSLAFELYDFVGSVLPLGTQFGFYFRGTPTTLIPIFDVLDQGPPLQSALVDFSTGVVLDLNTPAAVQSVFAPSAAPIGFFIQIAAPTPVQLFSDPTLNPGGTDVFGAFPFLTTADTFATVFFGAPQPAPGLQVSLVSNLRPVPSPSTLLLVPSALALAAWSRKRRRET